MKTIKYFSCLLGLSLFLISCSSGPKVEEVRQLQSIKDETTQLQKEVAIKKGQKSDLQNQVPQKEAKLAQATKDEEATKERLQKMQ
ncbi:MAG: hypothetical protein PHP42_11485 [Bacteroidota bacterium]|nr:hypothetical protein [Bacteroidota bacterium]